MGCKKREVEEREVVGERFSFTMRETSGEEDRRGKSERERGKERKEIKRRAKIRTHFYYGRLPGT